MKETTQDQDRMDLKDAGSVVSGASSAGSVNRHLVKAAGVVGLMTLASRILGMVRDILSAKRFGTSWQWDAFIFAFMIPNLLRRLVGEGALSSAFIPVYTETLQKEGKEKAFHFANLVMTLFGVGLMALLLLFEVGIHFFLQSSFCTERLYLLLSLLKVFFPYLWFISIYAVGMGILNCHKKFFAAALGPVILDLFWIAGVLWAVPLAGSMPETQLWILSLVILFSGAVQVAAELPSLRQIQYRFRWSFDFKHPGLKKAWTLLLPSVMSFGIVQLNLLVDQILAMTLDAGANSSLWYGTRMMQFPLGVFAIAMGTALLPTISLQAAAGDLEAAKKSISFALRSIFFIILPCSVGLIALRTPIVAMLFERGEFDAVSTARTASVMMAYSIGLFAFSSQKIITSGFYAIQDTKTPVVTGVLSLVLNLILNFIFMPFMKEAGLALATSIASMAQLVMMVFIFNRKVPGFPFPSVFRSFLRILLASLVMGFFCIWIYQVANQWLPGSNFTPLFLRVMGSMGISVLAYFGFCFIFRVGELKEAVAWMTRRRNS